MRGFRYEGNQLSYRLSFPWESTTASAVNVFPSWRARDVDSRPEQHCGHWSVIGEWRQNSGILGEYEDLAFVVEACATQTEMVFGEATAYRDRLSHTGVLYAAQNTCFIACGGALPIALRQR